MSTAAERLTREADDIRALAGEHGTGEGQSSYSIVELVLRIVAKCLLEPEENEQEDQAAA